MQDKTATEWGLIIVGNEILDGRRQDRHFDFALSALQERHLFLQYCLILPDQPELLREQLSAAFASPVPFFCCGGIGATPDDLTRDCAAAAAGVPIERHPEGAAILRQRWGDDGAYEGRMRMVDFPAGSDLIPNPVNQVPGFRILNGHFVPGFPEMAQPMMRWVLDNWYGRGVPTVAHRLVLSGAREADLVDIMESFVASHPKLSFSSLPRFVEGGTELHLGIRGEVALADEGLRKLKEMLSTEGWSYVEP